MHFLIGIHSLTVIKLQYKQLRLKTGAADDVHFQTSAGAKCSILQWQAQLQQQTVVRHLTARRRQCKQVLAI